jgi:dTDP-4-dehydrorhamnose 3,5-epimerase
MWYKLLARAELSALCGSGGSRVARRPQVETQILEVRSCDIPDVALIFPNIHRDDRGFFSEVFREEWLSAFGAPRFVQDNHVFNVARGVLRGLHFQKPPHAQGKLIRCIRGAILDVALDIRKGSPTFGQHVSAILSGENWRQLWAPIGFAHGYVTLEPDSEVIYKVTSPYNPASEGGIAWNDPELGIDWRMEPSDISLSPKDQMNPILADAITGF